MYVSQIVYRVSHVQSVGSIWTLPRIRSNTFSRDITKNNDIIIARFPINGRMIDTFITNVNGVETRRAGR